MLHLYHPGESVFARCLSSLKDERVEASKHLPGPTTVYKGDKKEFIEHIRKALYASKIVSYAQGFMLMREAAKVYNWKLNYGGIALMWRGGCIIRRWGYLVLLVLMIVSCKLVCSWGTLKKPMTRTPIYRISYSTTFSRKKF